MNRHTAISLIQRHSPLPAVGTYDATTLSEISEALEFLANHPTVESIPVLLNCANDESDPFLLEGAARVLAECPSDSLQQYQTHFTEESLPLRWQLAIYRLIPHWTSLEYLQQLLQEATSDDLREDIEVTIEALSDSDSHDEVDASMEDFKRRQKLPHLYDRADEAFRRQAYAEVIQILGPYLDILSPTHQKKLALAQRKIAR